MANKNLGEVDSVNSMVKDNSLIIEVDGSIRRITLDRLMTSASPDMMQYIEAVYAYGIEFDTGKSSPDCTRIGNMGLHVTLPIHGKMKGCLLSDSGTVNEYLSASDWTSHTLDGTKGQVMVEIPRHYRKFETSGTKRRVMISEYPLPGYHEVKKMYVSAYEATVESGNKLASIANDSVNGGSGTATATSPGRPRTSLSLTDFRTYARNRKSGSKEWNCMTYDAQKTLYWLFVVEYATLNTQKAYNAQKDSNGYAQGGLGDGVTNVDGTKWDAMNGYNPFIKCGYTDELGNGTGQVEVNMNMNTFGYDTSLKVQVPRYRGIENPFGHIWQWTDGILVQVTADARRVYVCSEAKNFADTVGTGYVYVGDEAKTEGYVKEMIFGEGGEIMPSVVGGSSSTYFCDSHYKGDDTQNVRGLLFGGCAAGGAAAGLVSAYSNDVPSRAPASFGSRLCFLPE